MILIQKVPFGSYSIQISFPCGPENAEKLTASALNELQKIINNGPEAKDLVKFKEAELLELKEKRKQNDFWISNLTKSFTYGSPLEDILKNDELINSLTAKEIQDVAKKYLTNDKAIGILMQNHSIRI